MNLIIRNIEENLIIALCVAIIFVAIMIILQKTWLKRYAHKAGVELPQDFDRTIEKFIETYTPRNISIKFQYRAGGETLGGCLGRSKKICLTQGWKLRILLDNNNENHDKLVNAYVETIWKEL